MLSFCCSLAITVLPLSCLRSRWYLPSDYQIETKQSSYRRSICIYRVSITKEVFLPFSLPYLTCPAYPPCPALPSLAAKLQGSKQGWWATPPKVSRDGGEAGEGWRGSPAGETCPPCPAHPYEGEAGREESSQK